MKTTATLICALLTSTTAFSQEASWVDGYVIVGIPNGFGVVQQAIDAIEDSLDITVTPESEFRMPCTWYEEEDEIDLVQLHGYEFQGVGEGPSVESVVAVYNSTGLHAFPRYLYQTSQYSGDYFENYHRGPVFWPDSLFLRQTPYPLGGEDPGTGLRYTRIVESWSEVDIGNYQEVCLQINDTSVWWHHKDIGYNLWQNLGEDVDHDGKTIRWYPEDGGGWYFDDWDVNYEDDDGNGLVDDLVGWDFISNDNNPVPDFETFSHGTAVASVAGAATGNWTGMSGVAVHGAVRIQPMRCGYGDEIDGWAAIDALNYAIWTLLHGGPDGQGQPVVVNMSWIGFMPWSALETMVECLWNYGGIPVCAAGNYGNTWELYPAAYHFGPIATASTKDNVKAEWSSYGPWVYPDGIAAPGEDILVMWAYVRPWEQRVSYITRSGTSFSAPHIAAAIANFWSQHADLTNEEVRAAALQHFYKPEDYQINDPNPDDVPNYYGHGILDALDLMLHGQQE